MIWSFSGSRLFRQCQRQWFYKTQFANALAKKVPLRREAYLLSKLQSVFAWRGNVVDLVISQAVIPPLQRRAYPQAELVLAHAREVFQKQLSFGRQHRLREHAMKVSEVGDSFAAFYAFEYGGGISDAEISSAWEDVQKALTNLLAMRNLLDRLKQSTHLVAQRALVFPYFSGSVRAVPDLIAFYNGDPPLIVDWKTHTYGTQDYRLQLASYAFALVMCPPHKDFPADVSKYSPPEIRLLEVQLLTAQQREYLLEDADIEALQSFIASGMTEMMLAKGDHRSGELVPSDFPVTNDPGTCQRCPFRSLCWEKAL